MEHFLHTLRPNQFGIQTLKWKRFSPELFNLLHGSKIRELGEKSQVEHVTEHLNAFAFIEANYNASV